MFVISGEDALHARLNGSPILLIEHANLLEYARTRGGGWESAAKRLYDFMLVQRREGAENQHEKKDRSKTGKKN